MGTGLRLSPGDFLSGCWSSVLAVPETRTYRPLRVPCVAVAETRGLSQPESDTCRCLSETRCPVSAVPRAFRGFSGSSRGLFGKIPLLFPHRSGAASILSQGFSWRYIYQSFKFITRTSWPRVFCVAVRKNKKAHAALKETMLLKKLGYIRRRGAEREVS